MTLKYLSGERIQGVGTSTLGSAGDATSNGSDLVTSGHKLGTGCLNFDGSSDYIDAYSGLQNAMNTTGSISIWFNADVDEDAILIAFCNSGANTKFECTTRNGRNLGIQLKVGGTQQWELSSSTLYNASGWNHTVLTHNGTLAEIYINGSLATMTRSSTTDNTKWWTALRDAGANGIAIGSKAPLNGNSQNEHFDGQLDDIGIWDRALTSSEVSSLYNSGTGALCTTVPSGLKVYYNCDSATVTNNAIEEKTTLVTAADTTTRQSYRVDDEEYVTVSAPNLNFTVPTGDAESSSFGGDTLTFDIGSALSDTAWVARVEMTFTSDSQNTNWQAMNGVALWISDTADGNVEDAQDCRTIVAYQSQNSVVKFGINARNNAVPEQSFTDGNAIYSSLTSTTYYVQFSYASDVGTMSITTNSDYTTGTSTGTKDVSGITGLRYLKITGFTEYRSGQYTNGSVIGNFQNIKICDTTSTFSTGAITYEPELSPTSNLPVGTRFEETDTRKIFRMKAGDWVEKGTA